MESPPEFQFPAEIEYCTYRNYLLTRAQDLVDSFGKPENGNLYAHFEDLEISWENYDFPEDIEYEDEDYDEYEASAEPYDTLDVVGVTVWELFNDKTDEYDYDVVVARTYKPEDEDDDEKILLIEERFRFSGGTDRCAYNVNASLYKENSKVKPRKYFPDPERFHTDHRAFLREYMPEELRRLQPAEIKKLVYGNKSDATLEQLLELIPLLEQCNVVNFQKESLDFDEYFRLNSSE